MIKWVIATENTTPAELEALSEFWKGGFGRALGFNFSIAPMDVRAYQTPKSRRSLARRIVKATTKKEGD